MSTNMPLAAQYVIVMLERNTEYLESRQDWVEVAAAVISAAIKSAKERKFDNWQRDVSNSLSTILEQLAHIQQQLRDMQVWLDERISEETRNIYHRRIVTLCRHVDQIIGAIAQQENQPLPGQLDDIAADFRELRITVSDLMQTDGYLHVMAVVTGVTCLMPLFYLLNRETELKGFAKDVIVYLGNAISPANPKSIEAARNTHASRIISLTNIVRSRLDVEWITNYTAPEDMSHIAIDDETTRTPMTPAIFSYQIATGTIKEGFSLRGRGRVNRSQRFAWYPELSVRYEVGKEDAAWALLHANLENYRTGIHQAEGYEALLSRDINEIMAVKASLESL